METRQLLLLNKLHNTFETPKIPPNTITYEKRQKLDISYGITVN